MQTEADAKTQLSRCEEDFPLGETQITERLIQVVDVGELSLHLVGVCATMPSGTAVFGAAAAADSFPVERAYFELLERLAIRRATQCGGPFALRSREGARTGSAEVRADEGPVRRSLSNGVALHRTWSQACESALHELVERDSVLRSFAGESTPIALERESEIALAGVRRALTEHYAVSAYGFPATQLRVAGVFLTPRHAAAPFVYGFSAGATSESAVARARDEALQRLGFLWGEEIPQASPAIAPTPDFHQEFYLCPANHHYITAWLTGENPRVAAHTPLLHSDVEFLDLTPPDWPERLVVAKARARSARLLAFGAVEGQVPHPIA